MNVTGRLGWCFGIVLLVWLGLAAGFVAGNLSEPVVGPAWARLSGASAPPAPSESTPAPARALADGLRGLDRAERKLEGAQERNKQELATAERALYLMEQSGAPPRACQEKEAEINRLRRQRQELKARLLDVERLRLRYQERARQGANNRENDWSEVDEMRIRLRLGLGE